MIDHEIHDYAQPVCARRLGEASEQRIVISRLVAAKTRVQPVIVLDCVKAAGKDGIVERIDVNGIEPHRRDPRQMLPAIAVSCRLTSERGCRCAALRAARQPCLRANWTPPSSTTRCEPALAAATRAARDGSRGPRLPQRRPPALQASTRSTMAPVAPKPGGEQTMPAADTTAVERYREFTLDEAAPLPVRCP